MQLVKMRSELRRIPASWFRSSKIFWHDGFGGSQCIPASGDVGTRDSFRHGLHDGLDHLYLVPVELHGLVVPHDGSVFSLGPTPDLFDAVALWPILEVVHDRNAVLLRPLSDLRAVLVPAVVCVDGDLARMFGSELLVELEDVFGVEAALLFDSQLFALCDGHLVVAVDDAAFDTGSAVDHAVLGASILLLPEDGITNRRPLSRLRRFGAETGRVH